MIGLIAGSRTLPFLFAREARRRGDSVLAVGFEGETDPDLEKEVDTMVWTRVGQLSRMIRAFTERGVTQCVMLGQIAPRNLFDLRPDLRAMSLMLRLKDKNAHTIFGGIGVELAKDGVELVPAVPWLQPWMPGPGYAAGARVPTEAEPDIGFGMRIAKGVSLLEIGQTVVVKGGTTLAVEGFEGTDACLERGGRLAGTRGGAVAVKVARENHDMRFDIPCVGPRTVETCASHGVAVLAFEAGKTLLIDRPELESLASGKGVALRSVQAT